MICLLVATAFEAGEFIGPNNTVDSGPQKIMLSDALCLVITGPGPVNTGLSLPLLEALLVQNPQFQFINVGIAGSLNGAELMSVHYPSQFVFDCGFDSQSASPGLMGQCYPEVNLWKGPKSVTVPSPLWNKTHGKKLAEVGCELVDMEAYVLARWASLKGVEMSFVKVVSDNGDETQKDLFMLNAKKGVAVLSEGIKSLRGLISRQETVNLQELKKCFGSKI